MAEPGAATDEVLIRRFMVQYPAKAEETGLDESLLTRVDESGALQLLETARYYIRRGDPASARYTLRRLLAVHPQTGAAATALDMCMAHGWMKRPAALPSAGVNEPATGAGAGTEPSRSTGAAPPEPKP